MKFWLDKNKEDIELLYKMMRSMGQRILDGADARDDVIKKIESIEKTISTQGKQDREADVLRRLDVLELWKADMHRMLIETSPSTGKPKLTKSARFLKSRF